LTAERLREVIDYDPGTGEFRWKTRPETTPSVKTWNARFAGRRAGGLTTKGYIQIKVDDRNHKGHRLAWLYYYGEWPTGSLDHWDRNRVYNAIENLRLATAAQQTINQSRSRKAKPGGAKGCFWRASRRRWCARIKFDGKQRTLGSFRELADAGAAYEAAARRFYGEFANLGAGR
jgi:hypothetical protein